MRHIARKTYPACTPQRVAFIGLGVMGYPMAAHLSRAGHSVTVYNRDAAKAQSWVQQCTGTVAATPYAAAIDADIVLCCVGNDDDVRQVILDNDGILAGLSKDAILIDHTTASAHLACELNNQVSAKAAYFVDAPISGGQAGAENGQLTIMCGAENAAFMRIQPVVAAYAKACTHIGAVGSGQLAKMVNQICIAGLLQGLSEALAFGEKAGLDMHVVLSAISQGAAQSWQMQHRAHTMLNNEFDFGFAVDWMRKDLKLVLEEAQRNGAQLPVTELVDAFYAQVQAAGGNRWDTSSLITRLRN